MTKNAPSPLALLVTGNEEFLRARAIHHFTQTLTTTHDSPSYRTAEADGLNAHQIQDLLSPELFGGMPLAHITTANKLTKPALAALIDAIPDPDCAFIIDIPKPTEAGGKAVIGALTAAGVHHEQVTAPKNAKDRRAFAQNELRQHGLRADNDALIALTEGEQDLRGVATRTRQLADDHGATDGNNPTITEQHVHHVTTTATINGFAVADALAARNPRALTTTLRDALAAGAADLQIQAACLMTLRDIANIQSGNTGRMAPWKTQKLRATARNWNAAQLAAAIHEMGVIGETVRSTIKSENDLLAALHRAIT